LRSSWLRSSGFSLRGALLTAILAVLALFCENRGRGRLSLFRPADPRQRSLLFALQRLDACIMVAAQPTGTCIQASRGRLQLLPAPIRESIIVGIPSGGVPDRGRTRHLGAIASLFQTTELSKNVNCTQRTTITTLANRARKSNRFARICEVCQASGRHGAGAEVRCRRLDQGSGAPGGRCDGRADGSEADRPAARASAGARGTDRGGRNSGRNPSGPIEAVPDPVRLTAGRDSPRSVQQAVLRGR
jgi:hypothetical protein